MRFGHRSVHFTTGILKMKTSLTTLTGMGALSLLVSTQTYAAGLSPSAFTTDGTLDAAYGVSPLVTQINISNSHAAGYGPSDTEGDPLARAGGEPGVDNAYPNTFTQLSNAYGAIDSANNLHLFIGGSISNYDSQVDIVIQSNSTGVSSLDGQDINSSTQNNVTFDSGFLPNAMITLSPTYDPVTKVQNSQIGDVEYVNLATSANRTPATFLTAALDNSLNTTLIGAGNPGDPGFAGAKTGLELSIPLASLGDYVPGTPLEVSAFVFENSFTAMDNQVLAPYSYFNDGGGNLTDSTGETRDQNGTLVSTGTPLDTSGRVDSHDDDYTYNLNSFAGSTTPGLQYFTVPVGSATTPEPTSLALVSLAGTLLFRRSRSRN